MWLFVLSNLGMGGGGTGPALVIARELHSIALVPLASGDPWSIDPERTVVISPDAANDIFAPLYRSRTLATSPSPTPWSIDPERTQQLPPN